MRHSIIGATVALALLSGCSGSGKADNASSVARPAVTPAPSASPSPALLATLPAAVLGRWGVNAADCDPAKADIAKGLVVINGSRLSFYESRGTAAHIVQRGGDVTFDLAVSGEGQQWAEPTKLMLRNGGRTLFREVAEPRDRAGVYMYERCPA